MALAARQTPMDEQMGKTPLSDLRRKAASGNHMALTQLAGKLAQTNNTTHEQNEGIGLLIRTAQMGEPNACLALAKRLATGTCTKTNPQRAVEWTHTGIRLAREKADTEAQGKLWALLATLHVKGMHPQADVHQAVKAFENAGECGLADGWTAAATLRMKHPTLTNEPKENIINAFTKGAEEGSAGAKHQIGMWLWTGRGPLKQDQRKGRKLLGQAAHAGDHRAQTDLGMALCENASSSTPEQAAIRHREAVKWFHIAAEAGEGTAAYNLGRCLEEGWGGEKNEEKARAAYRYAAKLGEADGWRGLAKMLEEGKGGEQDKTQALRCLHTAALEGCVIARNEIGERYEKGTKGMRMDRVQSLTWSRMACGKVTNNEEETQAQEHARERIEKLGKTMSVHEKEQSKQQMKQARQWIESRSRKPGIQKVSEEQTTDEKQRQGQER